MSAVDEVKPQQEANKLSQLQEMAKSGNPYDVGAGKVQAIQSDALDAVARSAAARGVPAGGVDELSQIVRMPGDNAALSMAAGRAAFDAAQSGYQAIGAKYAGAGVPASISGAGRAGGGGAYPGGYNTAGQYEDAVTAMARQLAQQQADAATMEQQSVIQQHQDSPLYASARSDQALTANRTRQEQAEQQDLKNQAQGEEWAKEKAAAAPPAMQPGPVVQPVSGYAPDVPAAGAKTPQDLAWEHEQARVRALMAAGTLNAPIQQNLDRRQYDEHMANAYTDPYTAPQIASWQGLTDQARDPAQLYRFAQNAAIGQLGADPFQAEGQFDPTWAQKLNNTDLNTQNDAVRQQIEYQQRQANGGFTDAEVAAEAARQRGALPQDIQASPEYATAAGDASTLLAQLNDPKAAQGQVTLNKLKTVLAQGVAMGRYPPEVVDQVLRDYGPRFPSDSYVPAGTDPLTGQPLVPNGP